MGNKWIDGIMGVVVGDALGDAVQFMSRDEVMERGLVTGMESGGPFNTPAGTWTDDSSMTLATLVSIVEKGIVDLDDIMQRFVDWLKHGEYTPFGYSFDIGMTCEQAISSYCRSKDVNTCGRTGEHANGNGALMRIMPACLYYYEAIEREGVSEEDAVEGVISVASLTHNHLRTNMCNTMYFYMVKSILDQKNKDEVRPLIDILQDGVNNALKYFGKDEANHNEMTHLGRLFDLKEMRKLPAKDIQSSGYVLHTIEAAVWSLITTESFKDVLLKAVNLGDDSDTVGAVTAGLAGLYYGYGSIPEEWVSVIQKREWIEELCNTRAAIGRFCTPIPMRPVDINEIKFVNRPL